MFSNFLHLQVNESEAERNNSAEEHRIKSRAYITAESKVQELHKKLKRSINKSRFEPAFIPYVPSWLNSNIWQNITKSRELLSWLGF